jgi:hypothetical protein
MNAIAFTREVRALSCARRRMAASTVLNNILRGAQERAPQDDVTGVGEHQKL